MLNVKTFTAVLKVFHVATELDELDKRVTAFLNSDEVKSVISVNDSTTNNVDGGTMGIIRVVTYEN